MRAILKVRKAKPFFARHPWVYAGAIDKIEGDPADGDEVEVVTSTGIFVARGLINSKSKIRIRLYTWHDEPIDAAFFRRRLAKALTLRQRILGLGGPGQASRLVF